MFIIAAALVVAAPLSSNPWPLAEKAFEASCPDAEQEELIGCGDRLMQEADRRIKRELCRGNTDTCARRFGTFERKRRAEIDRRLSAEGSVYSQLEAIWNGLETTLRYERAIWRDH